jgi:hypothetical protein
MPTYEPGYFYTVNIYEFIDDNLGSGNTGVETTDAVDADGWAPIYLMDSSPIAGSRNWLSADNGKQVNVTHKLRYDVRVWKAPLSEVQNPNWLGPNPAGILGDDDGIRVAVFQTWVDSIASYATVPKSFGNYVRQSNAVSGHGNTVFRFYVNGTDKGVIAPKIKITIEPGTEENPLNPEPVEVALGSWTDPLKMKVINFTKAKTEPKMPPALKELVGADRARWNACTSEWVGIDLKNVAGGKVDTSLVYYRKNGTFIRTQYLGREAADATGPNTIFGNAQEALLEAVRAVCNEEPPTPSVGEPSTPPDPDKVRYNPPNHFVTRSISQGERTIDSVNSKGRIITNVADVRSALNNRNRRLGKIYQSVDGAAALNKPTKGEVKLWGFRFTYNPQDLTYSTSTNTSIDWMLNSKDPANLLGGNTSVSIQLYLNRIADMTELKDAKGGDFSRSYPRALRKEEIEGILYRGTEYDLEFLYRVLNGDPGKTALLEYSGGKTADFGYITGTPCWFHLHNNLRYYGSMSSLEVKHAMFTQEMVPMLSTVTISFIRYPSLELAPDQVKTAFQTRAQNVASTGEEAKK